MCAVTIAVLWDNVSTLDDVVGNTETQKVLFAVYYNSQEKRHRERHHNKNNLIQLRQVPNCAPFGAFFEARRNATAPKKTVPNDSCAFLPDILPLSNFLLPK